RYIGPRDNLLRAHIRKTPFGEQLAADVFELAARFQRLCCFRLAHRTTDRVDNVTYIQYVCYLLGRTAWRPSHQSRLHSSSFCRCWYRRLVCWASLRRRPPRPGTWTARSRPACSPVGSWGPSACVSQAPSIPTPPSLSPADPMRCPSSALAWS